jgi:DNA gyrase inhibitor GyrI
MRVAYFEAAVPERTVPQGGVVPDFSRLWDEFNEWRLQARPSLGRIDIAAIGWSETGPDGLRYRAGVPIRSDYTPPAPARTTFFPGGPFAYASADNVDEIDEAAGAVYAWVREQQLEPRSELIEVYKFHYNLEQHPCDCGVLVRRADGSDPVPAGGSHASPLPIAQA